MGFLQGDQVDGGSEQPACEPFLERVTSIGISSLTDLHDEGMHEAQEERAHCRAALHGEIGAK